MLLYNNLWYGENYLSGIMIVLIKGKMVLGLFVWLNKMVVMLLVVLFDV